MSDVHDDDSRDVNKTNLTPAPKSGDVRAQRETPSSMDDKDADEPSQMMRQFTAMMGQFPSPMPLADKITSEHIDKMLDIQSRQVDHVRTDRTEDRANRLWLLIIICAFTLVLVGLLIWSGNDTIVEKVLIALIALVSGGLGGYGIRAARED